MAYPSEDKPDPERRQASADAQNELHTQIQYRLIEKISASERRYRGLIENLREIVFECDPSGILTFLNRAWKVTLGYDVKPTIGRSLEEFLVLEDRELWSEARSAAIESSSYAEELRFQDSDGNLVWLELSLVAQSGDDGVSFSGSLVDVTGRKKSAEMLRSLNATLEERVDRRTHELTRANQELKTTLSNLKIAQTQLLQSEKMSGLGQLVAGIAHEINNPTNFIYGNISYLEQYFAELSGLVRLYQENYPKPAPDIACALDSTDLEFLYKDCPEVLRSVQAGARRIRTIVRSLQQFARRDTEGFSSVSVRDEIENVLQILSHRLRAINNDSRKPKLKVRRTYGNLPKIDANAGQLNQALMNVLINAIDAVEARGRSQIESAERISGCIGIATQALDDRQVEIAISDNGVGIPVEIQSRIFDPFFTTKPVGKGTGMGMSIAYQIVTERHNGSLNCRSEEGCGTTFAIRLPIRQRH